MMKPFSALALAVQILAVLLLGGTARADDAISPERLALAKEMMALNGSAAVYDNYESNLDAMINQIRHNMPDVDDKTTADIKQIAVEEFDAAKPTLIEKTAEVYARHFSAGDLKALIAFYKTEAGQHFAAEMPALSQETVKLIEPFNTRFLARLKEYIAKRIAEKQAEQDAGHDHNADQNSGPDKDKSRSE